MFKSARCLLEICESENKPISQIMFERECSLGTQQEEEIKQKMAHSYKIMKQSVNNSLTQNLRSMGGLIGGEAKQIYARKNQSACGSTISRAISYAMGVLEVNASMGLIVAAPTAGSSGVIPGVFLALQEDYNFSDNQMIDALFNAGAIGYLITRNATVSGAEGGCQAEVGSACAMAASAVVELLGGTPEQSLHAAGLAISNTLGLVCDPVAGLVEVPCQSRNAMGASTAIMCAELALSNIKNPIPFDETIEAMYKVGKSLPFELRETALGGMAATPTGCSLCKQIF